VLGDLVEVLREDSKLGREVRSLVSLLELAQELRED
jgi:hypothetical protein